MGSKFSYRSAPTAASFGTINASSVRTFLGWLLQIRRSSERRQSSIPDRRQNASGPPICRTAAPLPRSRASPPRAPRRLQMLPASAARTGTTDRPASTRESELRARCRQVISLRLAERQKRLRHQRAYRMAALILGAGFTAAIAEKAGHRLVGANPDRSAEHVAGRAPARAASSFVKWHADSLNTYQFVYLCRRQCRHGHPCSILHHGNRQHLRVQRDRGGPGGGSGADRARHARARLGGFAPIRPLLKRVSAYAPPLPPWACRCR